MSWSIFADPPDDMETASGALLVNWNGGTGRDARGMADAYRAAASRLLDAACKHGESWESVDPVLYCFRHALELHLKALLPTKAKQKHTLRELTDELHARMQGRYKPQRLDWLRDRIREFEKIDSRSTSFRYHDEVAPNREAELWVDFARLRLIMDAVFENLEMITCPT